MKQITSPKRQKKALPTSVNFGLNSLEKNLYNCLV